nr:PREDICTED: inositol 1,4,5-trisphosphate receptor-interacting protein-like 1 [Opisthocomus hoazin]
MVRGELDEATRKRMQRCVEQLSQKMTLLLQEIEQRHLEQRSLEQRRPEQSGFAWGPLLLEQRGRSHELDRNSEEDSSSSSSTVEEEEVQDQIESDGEDPVDENDLGRTVAKRIQWPVQNLAYRSQLVAELMGNLLRVCRELLSDTFFPVLQPAISVGSTFEGWSPCEDDCVYHLFMPLQPPWGHTFHLEPCTAGQMLGRPFNIRVEQVCTCQRERLPGDMLCFLHHSEEELRKNQEPSLLHTLCTSSYLDVQKTAYWFRKLARSAWMMLPQSRRYHVKLLSSNRSCKLQLTTPSRRTLFIEMLFGVQQGKTDLFVSRQSTEAFFTPSTTWLESCAVAEVKFFTHMARQVPQNSFHLRCLQLYARVLLDTGFSTYTGKTAVMHLLTTTPLSGWRRRDFLLRHRGLLHPQHNVAGELRCGGGEVLHTYGQRRRDFLLRLEDIMGYLRGCLQEKRLNHFFFGNENVPKEIILPLDIRAAEPLNLFKQLAQDLDAHAEALHEFMGLQDHLNRLLLCGHWRTS